MVYLRSCHPISLWFNLGLWLGHFFFFWVIQVWDYRCGTDSQDNHINYSTIPEAAPEHQATTAMFDHKCDAVFLKCFVQEAKVQGANRRRCAWIPWVDLSKWDMNSNLYVINVSHFRLEKEQHDKRFIAIMSVNNEFKPLARAASAEFSFPNKIKMWTLGCSHMVVLQQWLVMLFFDTCLKCVAARVNGSC